MTAVLGSLRRFGMALAWLLTAVAIALGGAGIVADMSHPPGTPARAELTWGTDRTIGPALDTAAAQLASIGDGLDRLAELARSALTRIRNPDETALRSTVDVGARLTGTIQDESEALQAMLGAMPGDRPDAAIDAGSALLGRRSSMLDALEATAGLDARWADLTDRSIAAVSLLGLLTGHDETVARAAVDGRAGRYDAALTTLDDASLALAQATALRDRLEPNTDVSVLDEWLKRNRTYDQALVTLYTALKASKGAITPAVTQAYRAEATARGQLPPDTRGLVVIIGEVAQGGLNQAVIAIEQARSRLDLALEAVGPQG